VARTEPASITAGDAAAYVDQAVAELQGAE
jgi:hypothetical protein